MDADAAKQIQELTKGGVDHAIDGVHATATHADHLDDGEIVLWGAAFVTWCEPALSGCNGERDGQHDLGIVTSEGRLPRNPTSPDLHGLWRQSGTSGCRKLGVPPARRRSEHAQPVVSRWSAGGQQVVDRWSADDVVGRHVDLRGVVEAVADQLQEAGELAVETVEAAD
eukprot:gene39466-63160_t